MAPRYPHPSHWRISKETRPVNGTNITEMAGIIGGLVTQQAAKGPTKGRPAWPLYDNPAPDVAIPPAHCWRSVGKRTLSHPIGWSAIAGLIPFGGKVPYVGVIEPMGLPDLPLTDLNTTLTRQIAPFWDNDSATDRGAIEDMVLIGIRARMVLAMAGKQETIGGVFRRSNEWARALPQFMGHYLSFRTTHTAGRRDPWINDTPLAYIDRLDQAFISVPPLIWNTRDTTAEWVTRVPDFNSSATPTPTLSQIAGGDPVVIPATGSLFVEGLFVPDPDRCPDNWPGLWCPPQAIRGHRLFDPDFYARRRKRLGTVIEKMNPAY